MIELIVAEKRNPIGVQELITVVNRQKNSREGTLYIGYPILATFDDTIFVDAVLLTREHGLVIIDLQAPNGDAASRRDDIAAAMTRKLLAFKELRRGKDLSFQIHVKTFSPNEVPSGEDIITANNFWQLLGTFEPLSEPLLRSLNAAIETVTSIRPTKKRSSVKTPGSRGSVLKEIERQIANLDRWQKHAAFEFPDGPQRIRGLAGSGKTIVLALKASYLHAIHPEWKIVVTFQTRSLYQQFRDLINRFSFETKGDEPDWENLKIMHAWGGSNMAGVYYEIAQAADFPPKSFGYARQNYTSGAAFKGVCAELLSHIKKNPIENLYDAMLIDEAQDCPQPFFELCFHVTNNKRIVWAYDELQNLSSYEVDPVSEMFGKDSNNQPNVSSLENREGEPREDIVLPVCYRNTPWALTIAHALGLGIYRSNGLVQFFTNEELWKEIGYTIVNGRVEPNHHVRIKRSENSSPDYFEELLKPNDAVVSKVFASASEQAEWTAREIEKNLSQDELEMTDILVIFPDPITVSEEAGILIQFLQSKRVASHIVGVTSSLDKVFRENSIAISGIYRAKGNEAAMIYILNSNYCAGGYELQRRRNILFTAITRSRAWVRIYGVGKEMASLDQEVSRVTQNDYALDFRVPSEEELANIRRIHRELPLEGRENARRFEKSAVEIVDLLEKGLSLENLPDSVRERLEKLVRKKK